MIRTRIHHRIAVKNNLITIVILLALIGCAKLSHVYNYQYDISNYSTNTLASVSQKTLQSLPDAIRITAFIEKGQSLRLQIIKLVQLYKNHKKNISINFIDPQEQPKLIKEHNMGAKEVFVISYQEHSKKLNYLDEHTLTQALKELSNSTNNMTEIPVNNSLDRILNLSDQQIAGLNLLYLLVLPGLFFGIGLIIWQQRKAK